MSITPGVCEAGRKTSGGVCSNPAKWMQSIPTPDGFDGRAVCGVHRLRYLESTPIVPVVRERGESTQGWSLYVDWEGRGLYHAKVDEVAAWKALGVEALRSRWADIVEGYESPRWIDAVIELDFELAAITVASCSGFPSKWAVERFGDVELFEEVPDSPVWQAMRLRPVVEPVEREVEFPEEWVDGTAHDGWIAHPTEGVVENVERFRKDWTGVTLDEVRRMRSEVAERLARAEQADPGTDPIGHRLDEYRACLVELDAWIDDLRIEVPA